MLILALCGVAGCHAALQTDQASAPDRAFAVIAPDSAWFVFPREADTLLSWHIPGTRQYQGAPERIWTVQIGPYSVDEIFELTVIQEWRSDTRASVASLADIVRRSSAFAGRAAYDCICVTADRDPAIRAHVTDRRVRIVVYGHTAIVRWLGNLRDTVQFTRLEADTSGPHAVRILSAQAAVVRRVSR